MRATCCGPKIRADTQSFEKVEALTAGGLGLRARCQPIPLHVAHVAGANAAGVHQPACTDAATVAAGCNIGAKTTVASTYLADAEAFGAEIFTEMRVRSLYERPGRDVAGLAASRYCADEGAEISVKADIVVLGAGTLGSTEILLRSAREGLALSEWLGAASPATETLSHLPTTTTCP